MKKYEVISPEISRIEPVLDDGSGPLEYYSCYVVIEAKDKKDAKVAAIKTPEMKDWIEWQRGNDMNPYTGLIVNEFHKDPVKEEKYCWKEFAVVEGEFQQRLLTPWADPMVYEFPFDFTFDSPEEAVKGLESWGGDPDWILCKVTLEPIERDNNEK